MKSLIGFSPLVNSDARVLILGSMPSEESLKQKAYYAHPRNSFWYIMSELFAFDLTLSYEERVARLLRNKVAVWDVLKTCKRKGSLDSAIDSKSVINNEFDVFYQHYSFIKSIFFNGIRAEAEYNKRVLPLLNDVTRKFQSFRLPSTSPAMAALSKQEKLKAWSILKEYTLSD